MQRHEQAALARLAAHQLGLASTSDAATAGMSPDQLWRLRKAGLVVPVHRGVVRHAAAAATHDSRLLAAVLACGGGAVASHRSAAVLHGFDGIRRYRPELTVVGSALPRLGNATIHRTTLLDDVDRTDVRRIPCTTRARTALDLFGVLPYEVVEDAVQTAVVSGLLTLDELVSVLDRVGRPGRRGTAGMRTFIRTAVPDERLNRKLELLLDLILRRCVGVPPAEVQHRLVAADGRTYHLDRAWPAQMVTIEVDGHRWHATRKQVERDRARRRAIQAAGWAIYVYGWADAHDRPTETQAEIEAIFRGLSR